MAERRLTVEGFHAALVDAGVVRSGEKIRRIVIDAKVGDLVVIHIERYGDTRLLDVVRRLAGVEVRETPRVDNASKAEYPAPAASSDQLPAVPPGPAPGSVRCTCRPECTAVNDG